MSLPFTIPKDQADSYDLYFAATILSLEQNTYDMVVNEIIGSAVHSNGGST